MIILYYCSPSALSNGVWGSGVKSFTSRVDAFIWLNEQMKHGPLLITSIQDKPNG